MKNMLIWMTNEGKNTTLHQAVRFNHFDVVKLLIEEDPWFTYGANESGTTPFYMVVERGFIKAVKIIIDKCMETGTSPPYTGFMCRMALHAAVICNDKGSRLTILIMLFPCMQTKKENVSIYFVHFLNFLKHFFFYLLIRNNKDDTWMEAKPY